MTVGSLRGAQRCEGVLEVGRTQVAQGFLMGASEGSGSGSKGVSSECAGWAWACWGPESSSWGWVGGPGVSVVLSRSRPCTWGRGRGRAGRPRSGFPAPPRAPPPRRRPAGLSPRPAQCSDRLPAPPRPSGPAHTKNPPHPAPAPPRRSPIQMWVRGERAAPTSQASKMAPGGRL